MRLNAPRTKIVFGFTLLALADASPSEAQSQVDTLPAPEAWGIPDGYMVIQGDIIVPEDFYEARATYQFNPWPAGIVAYEFDPNVSVANRDAMLGAMAVWEGIANITFVPRTNHFNYIHIQDADANNSHVGMQPFSGQVVNINNWNSNDRTMVHELGHALGLWHEQMRSDRDLYVQIEWDNILPGYESNFWMYPGIPWPSDEYGPYDFASIMQYGACAFSVCSGVCDCSNLDCRTITVLEDFADEWQCGIGQGLPPSFWDARIMSFLYPQPGWRFVDETWTGTESGTFLEPYRSALLGLGSTPAGGTLWIQPGDYLAAGTWSDSVTLRAPLGDVTLGLGG